MQYLESLALLDYFFHPSFFLIPPRAVKKLEYGGSLSSIWWRRFARYPFPGVETLFIHAVEPFKDSSMNGFMPPDSVEDVNTVLLEDVAITGLKKCILGVCLGTKSFRPADLGECILRKNTELGQSISTAISESRAHMLINRAYEKVSDRISDYKSLVVHEQAPQFVEGSEGDESDLKDQIEEECIRVCIDTVVGQYSLRLANGEDLDQNSFMEDCFRMFSKGPKLAGVRKLTDANYRALVIVENSMTRLRNNMTSKDDRKELVEKYAKVFEAGDVEVERVADEWTRRMIRNTENEEEEEKGKNLAVGHRRPLPLFFGRIH
ncbi:hypothetical protein TWF506_009124 [Arthrobotrys conoides]|uniref:Uncharacterized protein n=1 Tax=Arthrobotrys conoides TaxID=74498 RepID=A0AAN8NBU6_9PEZI